MSFCQARPKKKNIIFNFYLFTWYVTNLKWIPENWSFTQIKQSQHILGDILHFFTKSWKILIFHQNFYWKNNSNINLSFICSLDITNLKSIPKKLSFTWIKQSQHILGEILPFFLTKSWKISIFHLYFVPKLYLNNISIINLSFVSYRYITNLKFILEIRYLLK